MKYINYIPLILAVLMYSVATYFVANIYASIADGISLEDSVYLPLTTNVACYLFLSGSILIIGFFIYDVLSKK